MNVEDIKIDLKVKYKNNVAIILNYNKITNNNSLSPDTAIGLDNGWRCDVNHRELELINNMEEINKDKEKQEFQLGDTAYMIDEDYRFFESEVYRIELKDGKYYYTADDCDFENKDIDDWVFTSELYRELHMEVLGEIN